MMGPLLGKGPGRAQLPDARPMELIELLRAPAAVGFLLAEKLQQAGGFARHLPMADLPPSPCEAEGGWGDLGAHRGSETLRVGVLTAAHPSSMHLELFSPFGSVVTGSLGRQRWHHRVMREALDLSVSTTLGLPTVLP